MIPFAEALARIADHVSPLGTETVPLAEASGRRLACDLTARRAAPRAPVSAMDGYAVIEAATQPGRAIAVIGEAVAGRRFEGRVGEGEAVRIFTGAPMPEGSDYVIMQEYATRTGDSVTFAEGYGPAGHVRAMGSDFDAGDVLVPAGTLLNARAMIGAAAADVAEVEVAVRPRVAIIGTGDELAVPGSAHAVRDAIPESVSYGVTALVEEAGGCVVHRAKCPDDLDVLTRAAGEALVCADLVIVTGGASVGDRDFAKPMFKPHGLSVIIPKVAIKPGKPVWLGKARGKIVLGLPGNPTSAMVTGALFLRPIFQALGGANASHRWHSLPLAAPLKATGGRETFVRARFDEGGLVPIGNQDSGAQAALLEADWLIRCPPDQAALAPGSTVTAVSF
ncbi:molybdopterin molybdotransferase MoeA [Erythrobacter aureus]|uniref:Molybdopterin molybdenumtransferase n=1 Tax=Erythrobacter aureus TaxID=2182384 RepID=A0A345YEG1_9SPHN|nr:molybdopterin molybdotransferase MoeA [Erythrobacter aureus]AXK42313.1 molybdopterin molybdenumtransferase MoeA [Erythrobacter aureus]